MRITISGPPGSGKTTACKSLAEKLGYESVVFGRIFREMAAEKNISLTEMGELAEKDPSIDEYIDSKILEIARSKDDIILESRLSAYMLKRNGIPAFSIYLYASPEVRISRVGLREGESFEEADAATREREASEAKRYKTYYDIDITDTSVYDLIVDTDKLNPEEVMDVIMNALEKC
ncbi:MAG: AAA family ATPase [Candidatus Methanomethylophilaceae archaeon]|nr:AAA family ATPase [Thermoplasmata archaeon]MBQ2762478.1 AAA family ATPase [Candidatus Methanomethylophilaceae archaeon]